MGDAKVQDCLLDPENVQNKCEADGFTREGWDVWADALRARPSMNPPVRTEASRHGATYGVECTFLTPDGRNPCLRPVWIIETGDDGPRLVTAY